MVLHRNLAEDIIMSQRNHLMTFFLDPFMHTLIQAGVSRIMYIAILFLSFSEFVGLSDKKYAIAQDYHISGSLCDYC
jgi:hypothetical protein